VALAQDRQASTEQSVILIGRRSVQIGFMAALLRERLGCACDVRSPGQLNAAPAPAGAVALLDVEGMSIREIVAYVGGLVLRGHYRSVAFVNVDEGEVDDVVLPGVQGIFYRDTSAEHLVKGLRAIFSGEYWLPRKVLTAHFQKALAQRRGFTAKAVGLTPKEAETLKLLVGGSGNSAIARRLGVSTHTVKTHIYHVFRKLGVKNRVQAVNWAMQNAESLATAASRSAPG
jgi:DNA-binding NarL/FixJ family response regulator